MIVKIFLVCSSTVAGRTEESLLGDIAGILSLIGRELPSSFISLPIFPQGLEIFRRQRNATVDSLFQRVVGTETSIGEVFESP